jgi:hypothetical protein
MIREDFILRMIRQLAEALARIARLRTEGKYERALDDAGRLYEDLGVPREVCDVVDTPTLAGLLAHPDKMRALAQVCWEEARIFQASGDPLGAFGRQRRALELFLEARAIQPAADDDAAILELSRTVDARHLDARYRDA